MTFLPEPPTLNIPLPDHTQLPESDGSIVQSFQEHPQSILLTESIWSNLQQIHPDGQFAVGQDCGIYWRITDQPLNGCKAPDWFYVPNVPPMLNGQIRRSYVMWQEIIAPIIVLEFASGDGSEERDDTPMSGKFWVYEQGIRVPFYGIYEVERSRIQVYQLIAGGYQLMSVNEREHYPIPPLGVELGIWQGRYKNVELPWLRWWDTQGNMLLTGEERAEIAETRAEQAETRADRLAARLRSMGIDPDAEDI
jgi:Uma2 family endonuclease